MKRTSVLLVSLVVLAAGCSGGDDGADTTSVSTRPVVTATTTDPPSTTSAPVATTPTTQPQSTTSTVTTDAPTTSPTTVSTDQTDWASVVQTLGQRRQDLYAAPDVSRIREVCAEESPCAEQLDVQLADLANKGWHVVDADPYTVVSASSRTSTATASTLHWSSRSLSRCSAQPTGARSSTRRVPWSRGIDPETDEGVNTENRTTLGRSGPPEDPWRIISQERIRESAWMRKWPARRRGGGPVVGSPRRRGPMIAGANSTLTRVSSNASWSLSPRRRSAFACPSTPVGLEAGTVQRLGDGGADTAALAAPLTSPRSESATS